MSQRVNRMRDAYRIGLARSDAARGRSGSHRHNWKPEAARQRDVDGQSAVAEMLVAEATGRRWLSDGLVPDDPAAGDVEGGIQVRWTERPNGSLIVHEDDPDEMTCVLVVGRAPNQKIVGWMAALEAKGSRFWRADVRHPAFFVPQTELLPMELLAA